MKLIALFLVSLLGVACQDAGSSGKTQYGGSATASGGSAPAAEAGKRVSFTEADLDGLERGLRGEIDAVKAAQARAGAATTAAERGEAMQAQWETATIPLGARASGLSETRYRDVRESVEQVLTILDFQGKIDGPLSIDLERADAATKERVSRDPMSELPPEAAAALRARMDRLVPVWSEYKKLVAVAG